MAGHTRSSLSLTPGECRLLLWGWARICHMAGDTRAASPAGRAAGHTSREQQVSRTTPPATSLLPSLSSTSRTERARSRLQAREFGKASQGIWEGNCKLGTFVHTHHPKVTSVKQTPMYLSCLRGLALKAIN